LSFRKAYLTICFCENSLERRWLLTMIRVWSEKVSDTQPLKAVGQKGKRIYKPVSGFKS